MQKHLLYCSSCQLTPWSSPKKTSKAAEPTKHHMSVIFVLGASYYCGLYTLRWFVILDWNSIEIAIIKSSRNDIPTSWPLKSYSFWWAWYWPDWWWWLIISVVHHSVMLPSTVESWFNTLSFIAGSGDSGYCSLYVQWYPIQFVFLWFYKMSTLRVPWSDTKLVLTVQVTELWVSGSWSIWWHDRLSATK